MCSNGDDGCQSMVPESTAGGALDTPGLCKKCGNASTNLYKLSYREPECCECFLAYARHKFRAALGSSKVLPKNADVLLIVDGSGESLALLDMLHYAQLQNTFKRLHCNARVLCLDDRHLRSENDLPLDVEEFQKIRESYAPFEFYYILCNGNVNLLQKLENYTPTAQAPLELRSKLQKIRSLTAQQDYLRHERRHLIGAVAEKLNCNFVFEAITSTTLATQLLSSIALGRGASAALDVSLLDDRLSFGGVKLLRPIKDLNEQEVQLYLHARYLTPLRQPNDDYGCHRGPSASLQNLTKAFIDNLQKNYSSTVSTVFRTGDKIAANRQLNNDDDLAELNSCTYCHSPLDYANSDTLLAIEYSRAVSEAGETLDNCGDELKERAAKRVAATGSLCYSCRNIQRELGEDLAFVASENS